MSFDNYSLHGGKDPHLPALALADESVLSGILAFEHRSSQENLRRLAAVVNNISPFVQKEDEMTLIHMAEEVDDVSVDEKNRQDLYDLQGESRIKADIATEESKLEMEGMGLSGAARRLFVFMNAEKRTDGMQFFPPIPTKGPSVVLGEEYYAGNWLTKRPLKGDIRSLLVDPLILHTHTFTRTFPTASEAIRRYKINEVDGTAGSVYSIVRDTSYADLAHNTSGQVTEIRERSRFAIIPRLLTDDAVNLLFGIVTAQNSAQTSNSTLRSDLEQFAHLTVEPALRARKVGLLGRVVLPQVFPTSTLFVALQRENTAV